MICRHRLPALLGALAAFTFRLGEAGSACPVDARRGFQDCVAKAGNSSAASACRSLAACLNGGRRGGDARSGADRAYSMCHARREGDMDCRQMYWNITGMNISRADGMRALDRAADAAAREVQETCNGTRLECRELMIQRLAAVRGKREEDITDFEYRRAEERGALEATRNAASKCVEARRRNFSALCEDLYERYINMTGKERPGNPKILATERERMRSDSSMAAAREVKRLCYDEPTGPEVRQCLDDAAQELKETQSVLLAGPDDGRMQRKMREAERAASREVLGESFAACVRSAEDSRTGKTECARQMRSTMLNAGVNDDEDSVLYEYRANLLMHAARTCGAAEQKRCREDARSEAIATGMRRREYAVVKRYAEVKAAARAWQLCTEVGSSAELCQEQAMDEFLQVSGTDASAYTDEIKERVQRLGTALVQGKDTVLRKRKAIDVTLKTNGSSCKEAVWRGVVDKSADAAQASPEKTERRSCRISDGSAEYRVELKADVPSAEIEAKSESIASALEGRDLLARRLSSAASRRLESATEAFVAQSAEECAVDDTLCPGDGAVPSSGAPGRRGAVLGLLGSTLFLSALGWM